MLGFSEVGVDDVALVGGKNASLGEMARSLGAAGIGVPEGFAMQAGDVDAIVKLSPKAARAAMAMGSHREALAHFRSLEPFPKS